MHTTVKIAGCYPRGLDQLMFEVVARPSSVYSLHHIAGLDPTEDKTSDERTRCHGRLHSARNPRHTRCCRVSSVKRISWKKSKFFAMPTAPEVELLTNGLYNTSDAVLPSPVSFSNFSKSR